MTIPPPVQIRARAFTLLEILLALAVSAIVLSAVSLIYYNAILLRNRTSQNIDATLPLQFAISVMKRDLTMIMPPGGTLAGQFQTTPSSTNALLNMDPGGFQVSPFIYTASGVIDDTSPFADVQKVAYYLQTPTNNTTPGRDLVRAISRNLLAANTEDITYQWLMSGVQSINFLYYDGTSWVDTWDSSISNSLPAAIKVQLVLAPEENQANLYVQAPVEVVVPVITQTFTNASLQTPGGGQ